MAHSNEEFTDVDGTVRTYDENGYVLTMRTTYGYSCEITRDRHGNELTFKDSDGFSYEYIRDAEGKILSFKDIDGSTIPRSDLVRRGWKV